MKRTASVAIPRVHIERCVHTYHPNKGQEERKIRKGGKATRIAEWRSGSERWGAPAVGTRISLPGPSHLCDDSHPPYRPRPDSESLPHDPGTLNRQMPQDGPLGSWREDGAPSSTVPSPLQAACRIHPSPSCKALSQCRGRGWMLRKILTRDRCAATSHLAPLVIPATTARSGYPRAWAKPRGSGGWDRRGRRRRYLEGQSGFYLVYIA